MARWHSLTGPDTIFLTSLGCFVPLRDGITAELAVLLADDACWCFQKADWLRRRPKMWHRSDRRAWRAEAAVLRAEKERIRALMQSLTCPDGE